MGALLSWMGRQGKYVPMNAILDANVVRRIAIEIYLPPVLSNIVSQYFSQQNSVENIETIYNRNKETSVKEVWECKCETEFVCTLSNTMTPDNAEYSQYSELKTFFVPIQDSISQPTAIAVRFRRFDHNEGKRNLRKLYWTTLTFSIIRPSYYELNTVYTHHFSVDEYRHVVSDCVKFLDNAILEFNHTVLLNITSLIDAHKEHIYLAAPRSI